ncbi:MAG: hypothetical protein AUJ72_02005 [Candidatus Omnitrophica bacterium CG1_02_46_14]|nr:MAG: hypothetical protein AUJ72_02005 [Candidatus Omnitrophica bacterium CG1_02_46_14]
MVEEAVKNDKPQVPAKNAAPAEVKQKKKKSWPTNCVQSNKRIHRKDWYYRNGKYFANKKAFKLYVAQEAEKASKAKLAQTESGTAAKTETAPSAPSAPSAPATPASSSTGTTTS